MPPNTSVPRTVVRGKLRQTQRWLQSAVIAPAEPKGAARHIAPSPALKPDERIAIYRDLYPARLVSALKLDYPLLCQYLGAPVFTQLALLYAQAHPSRNFTLNAFGNALPDFIGEVKGLRRPAFACDLARFEHACAEVFHEAEATPLSAEAIAAVPPRAWETARLELIPALRLLALQHGVQRYAEGQTKIPKRRAYLAIYRQRYHVSWLALPADGYRVLTALHQGRPLGESIAASRGTAQGWFRAWTSAGLFTKIHL